MSASRRRWFLGLPWRPLLLLAPLAIILVLALFALALLAPGTSALLAIDCLSDAQCRTPTGGRFGPSGSILNQGASAYLIGALFALLAYLSASLAVGSVLKWTRPARSRIGWPWHLVLTFAYMFLDTVFCKWLTRG